MTKPKTAADHQKAEKDKRVERALVIRAAKDDGPEGDIARDMLAKRNVLRQQLALAEEQQDIGSIKEVAAFAAALQKGAKVRGLGIEAENEAAEVVIRAERSLGRVLDTMDADGKLAKAGQWKYREKDGRSGQPAENQNLGEVLSWADLGLDYKEAGRYRLIARLSDEEFEAVLAARRAENERIAKVDFYRLARDYDRPVEAAAAIQQLIREDKGPASVLVPFKSAVLALNMGLLTTEELVELAGIIQKLAETYTAEKKRRQS